MTADPDTTVTVTVDPHAPVGTMICVAALNLKIVVIRHAKGWTAASDSCPHARCAFSRMGEVCDGTVLVCNCHGAEFDLLTGEVLRDPAEAPLRLFPVECNQSGTLLCINVQPRPSASGAE